MREQGHAGQRVSEWRNCLEATAPLRSAALRLALSLIVQLSSEVAAARPPESAAFVEQQKRRKSQGRLAGGVTSVLDHKCGSVQIPDGPAEPRR